MGVIRVGIIGTGTHGSRYVNHIINDVEGLELHAICRRSTDGRAQATKWNVVWFRDYHDLIEADGVDAVISVTPPACNLDIARKCAGVNKPLLLEKPLAVDSATAEKIVEIFESREPGLTVAQTLRYNSIICSLRKRLPAIGRLYSFSANQRLEPSTLVWHTQPGLAGAGVSFHTAVHVFDALRFITELEVRRVMALSASYHNARLEDLLSVLVEMKNGVIGTVDCSKVGRARSGRFEFVGYEGQLYGDQIHDLLEVVKGSTVIPLDHRQPVNTIALLLADWRDYLFARGKNPIPGRNGLTAVKICEACLLSARTNRWVNVA